MANRINAKDKGNRNELECVKILKGRFGDGFARVPSSGAWAGGDNRVARENMSIEQKITLVADIMTPPNFRFVLEHKAYEKMNFWDLFNEGSVLNNWTKQVTSDAQFVDKLPMLIMKFNHKQRIAMINVEPPAWTFCWEDYNGQRWYCNWLSEFLMYDNSWWFLSV